MKLPPSRPEKWRAITQASIIYPVSETSRSTFDATFVIIGQFGERCTVWFLSNVVEEWLYLVRD